MFPCKDTGYTGIGKIPMTIPKTIRKFLIVIGIIIGILPIPVYPVSLHGNIIFPLRFVALIHQDIYVLFFAVGNVDIWPACRATLMHAYV